MNRAASKVGRQVLEREAVRRPRLCWVADLCVGDPQWRPMGLRAGRRRRNSRKLILQVARARNIFAQLERAGHRPSARSRIVAAGDSAADPAGARRARVGQDDSGQYLAARLRIAGQRSPMFSIPETSGRSLSGRPRAKEEVAAAQFFRRFSSDTESGGPHANGLASRDEADPAAGGAGRDGRRASVFGLTVPETIGGGSGMGHLSPNWGRTSKPVGDIGRNPAEGLRNTTVNAANPDRHCLFDWMRLKSFQRRSNELPDCGDWTGALRGP